ncbi:MAG: hypothetical protein ACRDUT_00040 [Mycobacterium sp.]
MAGIGSTPALIAGTAVGGAAAAAFEPAIEVPRQEAWKSAPNRLPDLGLIAALVAGGKVSQADAYDMANRLGFSNGTFDSITWLAQNRLDWPVLLRMWRLSAVNSAFDAGGLSTLLDETLAHEQLDWDYRPYLRALKTAELVGLGDVAYGVVRGILPAPSWVPVAPPTTTTNVKRFPQVDIDPVQLAAALGFDEDQLKLMVGRSGLSMAPGMAAQALFRGILEADDYLLAVAEGDLRTEWGDALREVSRQILTAHDYAELQLRGFLTEAQRRTNTQKHGMTDADSDLLYDVLGRAPSAHQLLIGLRRGGTYDGTPKTAPEPYLSAMQRGNLRPEYYDVGYAARESYPSYFVIRPLVQSGAITLERATELFEGMGWPEDVAEAAPAAFLGQTTAAADPHVTKAETQLWTATHRSYVAEEIDKTTATQMLTTLGVAADGIPQVLALWDAERSLIRKQLTPTQVKKAFAGAVPNPATGAAWTKEDALTALLDRGYSLNDATTFLEL